MTGMYKALGTASALLIAMSGLLVSTGRARAECDGGRKATRNRIPIMPAMIDPFHEWDRFDCRTCRKRQFFHFR